MGLTDVWTDIDFYSEKRWHPTQKPLKLIERLMQTSSNPGDVVVDPFGGSGSTLIAAERLGRKAVIVEADEKYVNAMTERFTKGKETGIIS
jgi:site-specific DNA-methyltransferase (adenine-specific)